MLVSVVIPAFLEADNLKIILPKINASLKRIDYEVIVVDTIQSYDDTPNICKANNAVCLNRQCDNTYGDAIRSGIAKAKGNYIVIMDADGSHEPSKIIEFLQEMVANNYDLIIGSRYCHRGKTENALFLKFLSWILNVSYRLAFRINVYDISDSFRLYKASQLKSINLECNNFDIVEEILIKLNLRFKPLRIKEIPICFKKRMNGKSKRNLIKFIYSYVFTMFRLLKIQHKIKKKMQ